MDEIVDSVRNYKLDVDADSTNCSDTSANFNTPTAFNVITNQITSKIEERLEIPRLTLQQTAFVQQPISDKFNSNITPTNEIPNASAVKKPSYLNLACCVNGYSYLTTYDSKLRQNINNSREVSPIRPASNIIHHCKGPANLITLSGSKKNCGYAMENQSKISDSSETNITVTNGKYLKENNCKISNIVAPLLDDSEQKSKTFIQQRVERLYGVEAISKGFYSPKNNRFTQEKTEKSVLCERSTNSLKLNDQKNNDEINNDCTDGQNKDLPVFRHLRPEFRAQLPITPTKLTEDGNKNGLNLDNNTPKSCHILSEDIPDCNIITKSLNYYQNNLNKSNNMDVNIINTKNSNGNINDIIKSEKIIQIDINKITPNEITPVIIEKQSTNIPDGKYFLELLQSEQSRLLCLASTAETELGELSENSEISEDVLGFLRSAAGKARLLVSQKMKQFEGLCIKNLNPDSADKFPTTISDLQGFWDMVTLQVDHIDSIFKDIQLLKENDWKRLDDSVCLAPSGSKLIRRPVSNSNLKNKKIISNEAKVVNVDKSNNTTIAAQKRDMQRKQLMELKRKNKIALASQQQNGENNTDIISKEIVS